MGGGLDGRPWLAIQLTYQPPNAPPHCTLSSSTGKPPGKEARQAPPSSGNHAPSSKRGCMQCLGIFQSSASLSTIKKHCYAPLPLNASYKSIYDLELSKFIGPLYAVYKSVSSIGVGLYATLIPTDASHSSGQTLNTLRVRRWNVCIDIP